LDKNLNLKFGNPSGVLLGSFWGPPGVLNYNIMRLEPYNFDIDILI
jgi:hypothetical protein